MMFMFRQLTMSQCVCVETSLLVELPIAIRLIVFVDMQQLLSASHVMLPLATLCQCVRSQLLIPSP